jgi:hypothetical protein
MRYTSLLLIISILIISGCGGSQQQGEKDTGNLPGTTAKTDTRGDHFYGVKSGRVVYETESISQKTREELYFDDWGEKEARYIDIIQLDPRSKAETGTSRKLTLRVDGNLYNLNLDKQEGTRTTATPREPHYDPAELKARLGSDQKVADYLMARKMYMQEEKEEVLGYPCQVVKRNTSKTSHVTLWFWEGLVLKSETIINAGNSSYGASRQAVEFEPGVEIDPSRFEVPAGFPADQIQEVRNLMDR